MVLGTMQLAQATTPTLSRSTEKNPNLLLLQWPLLMFLMDLPPGKHIMELENIPLKALTLVAIPTLSLTPEESLEFLRTLSTF